MVSQLGTLLIVFGFWKYGFASDCIEMYIKPNTTAEVVCPNKGNQTTPITWKNSKKIFIVGNTVGVGEVKFRISSSHEADKSILQIVNFSARDEDMYRCSGLHDKQIFEECFNIHVCNVPMEMNLFSETDNNAKNEKLKNVLCTVADTAVATTQVHSSVMTNEQLTNIRGIIQNVTCSVLNMDQCFTANITLQLNLTWREKEDPNNTVSGSEKEEPTDNSFHNIAYGNCSYPVSCDCGSLLSTKTAKHMYKGFFKKWNLFLKNYEPSDYCDCILYTCIHKGQGNVTSGSHDKIVYLVSVLSTSIAMLVILTVIGVYLIFMKRNTVNQINNDDDDDDNNTTNVPAISQPGYGTIQPGSVSDVAPLQSTNVKPQITRRTNNSAGNRSHIQHQESSRHTSLDYIDVVFDPTNPIRKFFIRGEHSDTPYADIDLTLKADPLPDSESSDSSDDEAIINMLVNQI